MSVWDLALDRMPELWQRLVEHAGLSVCATLAAIAIGLPLGVWAHRWRPARSAVLNASSIVQTIPSLALLTFLLPLFGIGTMPALIALTLYALLPIVRSTVSGFEESPRAMIEMADALGMTRFQRVVWIEARLAAPFIVSGVRIAAVVSVGIATLSAFVGAGGLGAFINRGLALNNTQLVLLGAIPSALFALYVDAAFGSLAGLLRHGPARRRAWVHLLAVATTGLVAFGGFGIAAARAESSPQGRAASMRPIVVGSKNFTEQLLLGEVLAQLIERDTGHPVRRRLNLAGTAVLHRAMEVGAVDVYVEYTGTALASVLRTEAPSDAADAFLTVRDAYAQRFGIRWLQPLGFGNTYAIAVRRADAAAKGWTRVSELAPGAPKLRAGFTAEFMERPDGYPGLRDHYGMRFASVRDLEPTLMYEALRDRRVDVIGAFSTDGRIETYDFLVLEDDLRFFPPYDAAVLVREQVLERHPEVEKALMKLSGRLDEATMRRLNGEVDQRRRAPREVAAEFVGGIP